MSHYKRILSFLRVLRSDPKAQPPKLGFFMSAKKFELSVFTTLVSLVAVLGPFSYGVLALYEIGRLGYFNAPVDFLQLGSFGFADVILKAYPSVIPMAAVVALSVRFLWLKGVHRAYAVLHIVGLFALLLINLVNGAGWKTFWICVAAVSILFLLIKNPPALPETGNESQEGSRQVETRDQKFWRIARWCPALAFIVFILGWMVSAYGAKNAELETYYWCTKDEVVLGFYGDKVLTSKLQNGDVGHTFSIRDVKTLTEISYQKIGPLKVIPLWKPALGR
ncbi:hypothetical protein [Pseudomonas sp. rhizo25]|uniref:hypothetical protein n=1 Tax=Pseudomonas sp. rhizo25 TaxID=3059675 RepID=UPI002890DAE0|nr:hypothetical protein [Pseudomonas sp. rhizo25]MDT3230909.1 hypothetical protein [Pseudomonas sp. rhizo25]